jgi:hypothetical protein
VQADVGEVMLGGGASVTMGSANEIKIYANSGFKPSDPLYAKPLPPAVEESHDTAWGPLYAKALDWVGTIAGIVTAGAGIWTERKEALHHKTGWKQKSLGAFGEIAAEVVRISGVLHKGGKGPSVEIQAEQNVGISAGNLLELYGSRGAELSSPVAVDVLSTTVGVKAATYASFVGGVGASVMAVKEAVLMGGFEACVKSPKTVHITGTEHVGIGSEHGITVKAESGGASIYGKKWVYAGSNGYGMKANDSQVEIGKMSSPTDFGAAKGDTSFLHIDNGSVKLTQGDGAIVISQGGNNISIRNKDQKSTLGMLGGVVKISAKCILLDD